MARAGCSLGPFYAPAYLLSLRLSQAPPCFVHAPHRPCTTASCGTSPTTTPSPSAWRSTCSWTATSERPCCACAGHAGHAMRANAPATLCWHCGRQPGGLCRRCMAARLISWLQGACGVNSLPRCAVPCRAGLSVRIVRPSIVGGTSLHHICPGYIGNAAGALPTLHACLLAWLLWVPFAVVWGLRLLWCGACVAQAAAGTQGIPGPSYHPAHPAPTRSPLSGGRASKTQSLAPPCHS